MMKNGVLYIVDEDDEQVTAAREDTGEMPYEEENTEIENEYSAEDLAVEGDFSQKQYEAGFWNSLPGYATLIGIVLIVLALAMFFLFFGVIVTGEMEEHDEVFELCAIRLMRRREGKWCVKLGSAFDDNAVLKLRIGILFAVIFNEWDVTGEVTGLYEGEVTGQVQQGMLLYRKNIRRSV